MRDYYSDIPIGRENAISREALAALWNMADRRVRQTVQNMREEDNGDGYVIISNNDGSGYFRSDDLDTIRAYVGEVQGRANSIMLPLNKAKRILSQYDRGDSEELSSHVSKLAYYRTGAYTQEAFVREMRKKYPAFDRVTLSKAENGTLVLTPLMLVEAARLLSCRPQDIYPSLFADFRQVLGGR